MSTSPLISFILSKTTVTTLYDNPIVRFLLTEESGSIWNAFQNPYKKNSVVKLAKEEFSSNEDPLRNEYIVSIPFAKLYKGMLLQGYCISPKFLRSLESFEIRNEDIFIISYPRSGTTWTEEIVSLLHSKHNENTLKTPLYERVVHLEVGRCLGQKKYLDNLRSPRLLATHLSYDQCPKQLRDLNCKIIYIVRNPKDQAVSYYHFHQTAKYLGGRKWDWNSFLHLFKKGYLVYGSWTDHVEGWWRIAQKRRDKVLFLSYEELHLDLEKMVRIIADFIDRPVSDDFVKKMVNHCSFKAMRSNSAVNRTEIPLKNFFDQSQVKFMRKGVVGDWRNYFDSQQEKEFDDLYGNVVNEIGLNSIIESREDRRQIKSNEVKQ